MRATALTALIAVFLVIPMAFATLSGPSPIPSPSNFYITSSKTMLCAGQVNEIPLNITNKGAGSPQMQNLVLGITNGKTIYLAGNGTVNAGDVNSNTSKIVYLPIFVSANSSSLLSLGLTVNYYFDTLYSDSETRNLTFSVSACASPLSVSISPNTLTTGSVENMSIVLKNNGNATLNSIVLRISLPSSDGAWLGKLPIEIGTLAPGAEQTVTGSLLVYKNDSETVPFNITATFYNGTLLNQVSSNMELLASGMINMTPSSFATSPTIPTAGSIFSVSFILTDIGTAGASAVTATPILPKGFSSYGSNQVFIGDMAVDSQTPVTVSITAAGDTKPGKYDIPIRINYLNSFRQNMTAWANTTVILGASAFNASQSTALRNARGKGSGIDSAIIVILVIAVAALAYLLYKEKKSRNKK